MGGGEGGGGRREYFCRTEQAAEGLYGKKKLHFLMGIYVDINLRLTFFLCVPVSFGELFIKRAQIQSY